MICPKCRKRYPDDTKYCPDCGFELVCVVYDLDISEKSVYNSKGNAPKMKTDDAFSPVVYKTKNEKETEASNKNILAIIILIIGLLFLAACAFFLIKGKTNDVDVLKQYIIPVFNSFSLYK